MTTDFRALCAELVESVEVLLEMRSPNAGRMWTTERRLRVARAALADEPAVPEDRETVAVAGQPSDEELLELAEDWPATTGPRHDLSGCPEVPLYSVFADEVVEFARAVLARWGNTASQPPADGEVDCISIDEMCEILRSLGIKAAEYTDCTILYELTFEQLRAICDTRAFALSRRTPAAPADGEVAELVPVPVSERLPGPEDCDAEGRCWFLRFPFDYSRERWSLEDRTYGCNTGFTHWLSAHALPVPEAK